MQNLPISLIPGIRVTFGEYNLPKILNSFFKKKNNSENKKRATYKEINKGLLIIKDHLKEIEYKPDFILGIDKNGGVIANMLFTTSQDSKVFTINVEVKKREIERKIFEEYVVRTYYDYKCLHKKKVLIVFFKNHNENKLKAVLTKVDKMKKRGIEMGIYSVSIFQKKSNNAKVDFNVYDSNKSMIPPWEN